MGRWIHDHGKIKIESNFQHFTESCCASIQCHEFLLSPNFCNFINFTWNHLRWDKFFAQNHDKLGKSLFMDFIFHANAEKWNQVNAQFTEILVTTVVYILKMLLKLQKSLILRVLAKILDIFGPNMTHFKKTLCVCVLLSESESNLSHKGKFRDPTISRKKSSWTHGEDGHTTSNWDDMHSAVCWKEHHMVLLIWLQKSATP